MNQLSLMELMIGLADNYLSRNAFAKFKQTVADNSQLEILQYSLKLKIISSEWAYLKISDMTLYDLLISLKALHRQKTIDFTNTLADGASFTGKDGLLWTIKIELI